jgi:hypothetical protein
VFQLCVFVNNFTSATDTNVACELKEGRDSSVGIATRYGLDGPGDRIPAEARFSTPVQTSSGAHPPFYTMGTGSLSRG